MQRIRLWEQVSQSLEGVIPGSLKSVHGCLSVPAAATGWRHCPAKGAAVSVCGAPSPVAAQTRLCLAQCTPKKHNGVPPFVAHAYSSPHPGQRLRPTVARLSCPSESKAAAGLLGREH